jgi:HEAT repeat protein
VAVLGQEQQAADLVGMLQKTSGSRERASIEKALLAVTGRGRAKCLPHLRPLIESRDEQLQMIGLHAMAIVGGPEALATVKSAMAGDAGEVQDEAVRILSTWPNNWPDDADAGQTLLTLAKSGEKMSHKVLGLRGYLTYVRGNTNLTGSQKVAKVKDLLPLIERPEEERLAIAALGEAPDPAALEMLIQFTQDAAVAEEAYSAIVNLATKNGSGLSKQQRREALQTALEKSKNNATRLRARRALRGM